MLINISLAKLADKLIISKALNKNRASELRQTSELNTIIENMVNNRVKDVFISKEKYTSKVDKADKNWGSSKKKNTIKGSCYYCDKGNHPWSKCFKLKAARKEGKDINWVPKNRGKNKFSNESDKNDTSVNFIDFNTFDRRACSKSTIVNI